MASIIFGTGKIVSVPNKLNPTPVVLGEVIDLMVDINQPLKQLIGSKQFPIAVARGPATINLKAKLATFAGPVMRDLFFGVAKQDNQRKVEEETVAIPAAPGPYTVTVVNGATFAQDLGVFSPADGQAFTRVDSLPGPLEYSVDEITGTYEFNAADAEKTVIISYAWNDINGGGSFTVDNQLMGYQPVFSISVSGVDPTDNNKKYELVFNRVVASKFSFPLTNEDFAKPDFEMEAFADDFGKVLTFSTSDEE